MRSGQAERRLDAFTHQSRGVRVAKRRLLAATGDVQRLQPSVKGWKPHLRIPDELRGPAVFLEPPPRIDQEPGARISGGHVCEEGDETLHGGAEELLRGRWLAERDARVV